MPQLLKISLALLAFLAGLSLPPAGAVPPEKRLALVIGNTSYKAKALATLARPSINLDNGSLHAVFLVACDILAELIERDSAAA
jgi:hypothetical protein